MRKHPVRDQGFDGQMLGIREQTGRYPRETLEDIVLYWDMIDEKYGVGATRVWSSPQERELSGWRARCSLPRLQSLKPD